MRNRPLSPSGHHIPRHLFPLHAHAIRVSVREGIVTLRGPVHDTSLIRVAERLVRGLEGVVDVESRLSGATGGPE
ncbi:BON domain-containing protein [Streptomyces sp. NPDC056309]|uniref:BON domain-containing protein n=1 Tax=unclassified Streptomyces TaxID=2593676 RepID=UPI0035D88C47